MYNVNIELVQFCSALLSRKIYPIQNVTISSNCLVVMKLMETITERQTGALSESNKKTNGVLTMASNGISETSDEKASDGIR
jgi:hypothetical protein